MADSAPEAGLSQEVIDWLMTALVIAEASLEIVVECDECLICRYDENVHDEECVVGKLAKMGFDADKCRAVLAKLSMALDLQSMIAKHQQTVAEYTALSQKLKELGESLANRQMKWMQKFADSPICKPSKPCDDGGDN